jgi:hypothetical protein
VCRKDRKDHERTIHCEAQRAIIPYWCSYPNASIGCPCHLNIRCTISLHFFDNENISTVEHISCFLAQCGGAVSAIEPLILKFFPLPLSGLAYTSFASPPPNSISGWVDLKMKFHKYFFIVVGKIRLLDLTVVHRQASESLSNYIQRFKDVRIRCFSLNMIDQQLTELVF